MNEIDSQSALEFSLSEEEFKAKQALFKAINQVYHSVGYVQKEGKIAFGGSNYSYASEADFIKAIRPEFSKVGLSVVPLGMAVVDQQTSGTPERPKYLFTISAQYRISHVDGASVIIQALGQGSDSGDKAIYKAMTGAFKYALRQSFMIETGDDPDKTPSGMTEYIDDLEAHLKTLNTVVELDAITKNPEHAARIRDIKAHGGLHANNLNKVIAIEYKRVADNDDGHKGLLNKLKGQLKEKDIQSASNHLCTEKIAGWVKKNLSHVERQSLFDILYEKRDLSSLDSKLFVLQYLFECVVDENDINYIYSIAKEIMSSLEQDVQQTILDKYNAKALGV